MKKRRIAKAALAVLSIMTIGAGSAALAACGDKHSHSYGDWVIIGTQPTLTDGGTAERYCKDNDGGKETINIPSLSDTSVWTENTGSAVSPTHTTDGSRTFESEYGTVTIIVPKDANAHTYGAWTITQEPTMTAGGKAERTCTATDAYVEKTDIPALSDTEVWSEKTADYKAPTHSEAGKKVYTSVYGDVTVIIPADENAHTFGDWAFVGGEEPSLTSGGRIMRVCTDGDAHEEPYTEYETVPALSDASFWTQTDKTPATHQHAGVADFTNSTYNIEVTDVVTPVIAHTFSAWKVTVAPTDTTEGEATRVCTSADCADDDTATETFILPVLTDATFWTAGAPVDADYNHPGSITYTNDTYGSVRVITAPKLTTPYDNKVYSSVNIGMTDSGHVSVYSGWSEALMTVGDEGFGSGTGYPFRGKLVFELLDVETGYIKITHYGIESVDEETSETIYNETADSVYYAYVDAETGVLVIQSNGSWSAVNVAVPSETAVSSTEFTVSTCVGDYVISHNGTTMLVTADGVTFGVTVTDIDGNTLSIADCFSDSNTSGTAYVKDADGNVVKGYALNSENKWVVCDGLEGIYKLDNGKTVVVNGASGVTVISNGAPSLSGTYKIVSGNVIGAIVDNVYYEFTLSGNGMSQNGGTCTEETPKVNITINFNGYLPEGEEQMIVSIEWSKYVPAEIAESLRHATMEFRGWYLDAACTIEATTVDGAIIAEDDVTLYAKWSEKIVINLTGLLSGDADNNKVYFGEGDVIGDYLTLYTKEQIDEASNKYFDGWYLDLDGDGVYETPITGNETVSSADDGLTIQAKWVAVPAYSGSFTLFDTGYGESNKYSGSKSLTISVSGGITGSVTAEVISYDPVTKKLVCSKGTSTFTLFFDETSGMMVGSYSNFDSSNTFDPKEVYFGVKGVTTSTDAENYGLKVNNTSTYTARFVAYGEYIALLYDGQMFTNITVQDAIGNDLAITDIKNSKTVIVRDAITNDIILAVAATSASFSGGSTTVALDEYFGTYTGANGDIVISGAGDFVWGDKTGTYSKNGTSFDLYVVSGGLNTEYWQVTLSDGTYTAVKPVATITINLVAPDGATLPDSFTALTDKNFNIDMFGDLPDGNAVNTDFVFNGFFTDAACTSKIDGSYIPTSENITIYAKYSYPATLTLVFNDGETENEVIVYSVGDVATLDRPSYDRHVFAGWFLNDGSNGGDWGEEWTNGSEINTSFTIYAKWEEAPVYALVNYHQLAINHSGTGSGTNANGSGHWVGTLTFDEYGTATGSTYPLSSASIAITDFDSVNGTLTFSSASSNVGGDRKGYIDVNTGIMVVAYSNDDFNKMIIFTPEYSNYAESYWNNGTTHAISFNFDGSLYCIFVHEGVVYFNVSFENAAGDSVAANAAYQSTTLYVKDADSSLIAKFGYDGNAMIELDGYEDITYTGANGDLTVDGVANITLDGVEGTYTLNKADGAAYTADAYIGNSYYEVTLDKSASTYTIVKRMVTVTFVTAYDGGNAESGDYNKNIAITLPHLTDDNNVLLGWYIDDETQLMTGEYIPTGDVTLTAKWAEKVVLTIVYGNGLENGLFDLVKGSSLDISEYEISIANDKMFDGWYSDAELSEKFTGTSVTGNMTVYAKWVDLGGFTVTKGDSYWFDYDTENGYWASNNQGVANSHAQIIISAEGTGPVLVEVTYWISSEYNYDYLYSSTTVGATGAYLTTKGSTITQENALTTSFTLEETSQLTLEYTKDGSGNTGSDTAWLIIKVNGVEITGYTVVDDE